MYLRDETEISTAVLNCSNCKAPVLLDAHLKCRKCGTHQCRYCADGTMSDAHCAKCGSCDLLPAFKVEM